MNGMSRIWMFQWAVVSIGRLQLTSIMTIMIHDNQLTFTYPSLLLWLVARDDFRRPQGPNLTESEQVGGCVS